MTRHDGFTAAAASSSRRHVEAWPFTGRSDDLDRLGDVYLAGEQGGVVVLGPAGAGKTRLVEEALALAELAELPIARAVGHAVASEIPLGALAHLLPTELVAAVGVGADERNVLFHAVRAEIARFAGDQRLILAVDDLDLLDDTSMALLVPLIVSRDLFVIGTVRSGRTPSARLSKLQRDGHLARIDLDPLALDDISTLLHRALDAPVSERTLTELARLSGGNLQILTELVRAGQEQGTMTLVDGVWHLSGSPGSTVELDELIAEHLATVDRDGRSVLELLAICERFGLSDLEETFGPELLERLEADGLIRLVTTRRRSNVRLAHPLYGELLAAQLPPLRRRAVHRQLADLTERHGSRRREDQIRGALWRLDSGGDVDPERLLRAARLALIGHDPTLTLRILDGEPPPGTDGELRAERFLALGEAAARLGRTADAERWLGSGGELNVSDDLRAQLALRLADMRFFAGRDLEGALHATERARAEVRDPAAIASLDAQRAVTLANAGRPVDALAVIDTLDAELDARTSIDVDVARAASLISVGRCGEGAELARDAARRQLELPSWLARRGGARHLINEAHALGYAGHYRAAYDLLLPAVERAKSSGALAAWVWIEMTLGEITRDMGRAEESVVRCQTVVDEAAGVGQEAALVWAHVGVAQGHLLAGRCDPAADAIERAGSVGSSPVATSRTTLERARAWLAACRGDLAGARDQLLATADDVRADGVYIFEAAIRHDVARFGDPATVVDRLTELGSELDGPVFPIFAAHARALVGGDATELERCVDRFEEIECFAGAAEAAAEAADLHARSGDQRAAAAARRRSGDLAASAGGLATPPLARGSGVEPLTSREREIALLAAAGSTSRDIGERLFVSTRTVDTHLARVYRKLGISGRGELADALGKPTSGASG